MQRCCGKVVLMGFVGSMGWAGEDGGRVLLWMVLRLLRDWLFDCWWLVVGGAVEVWSSVDDGVLISIGTGLTGSSDMWGWRFDWLGGR